MIYNSSMATKTTVTVLDDLDGSEDASTIAFAFDGTQYEIDLSTRNRDKMAKVISPYIENARRVGRASSSSSPRRARGGNSGSAAAEKGYDTQAIREWAQSQGIEVGLKGRVPNAVVEQYEAAQTSGNGRRGRPRAAAK